MYVSFSFSCLLNRAFGVGQGFDTAEGQYHYEYAGNFLYCLLYELYVLLPCLRGQPIRCTRSQYSNQSHECIYFLYFYIPELVSLVETLRYQPKQLCNIVQPAYYRPEKIRYNHLTGRRIHDLSDGLVLRHHRVWSITHVLAVSIRIDHHSGCMCQLFMSGFHCK